jgi:protease-4
MKDRRKLLWVFGIGCLMAVAFGFATYKSVQLAYKVAFGSSKNDSKGGSALDIFGGSHSDANIAIVDIEGVIMSARETLDELKEIEEDKDIKAIVVHVNSPGGAVAPSQEIYDRLLKLRDKKKIVCSFDSVAASGGYYIGAGCEKIVSNPGTMTGSIGVIMPFMNLKDLYQWAKLSPFNIKSGKFKDIGSESRPMTDDERNLLQAMVTEIHSQFKAAIKAGRPQMSAEVIENYADGRIFSGSQAKALGFVDELGGEDRAVELAAELAQIKKPKAERWGEEPNKLKELLGDLRYKGGPAKAEFLEALKELGQNLSPLLSNGIEAGVPYLLPQHWFSGKAR